MKKTQTKKITYIFAAILVAAICVFSVILINAAGTHGTASADIQTGKQITQSADKDEAKADPTEAQLFFKEYPWIFLVGGAGLSLIVALISFASYTSEQNPYSTPKRKKK